MAETTTSKGRTGEDVAVTHLVRAGYEILGRNVRTGGGEIDVVAMDGAHLCFIEVRRRERAEDAVLSIDRRKQARIIRAANGYLARMARPPPLCRFDVVVIGADRVAVMPNAFVVPT